MQFSMYNLALAGVIKTETFSFRFWTHSHLCVSMFCSNTEKRIARKTYLLTQISAYSVWFRYLISFINLDLGIYFVGVWLPKYSGLQNFPFAFECFAFCRSYKFFALTSFAPLHFIQCHFTLPKFRLPRKEVIQPHLPVRLPCYDFTPVTNPALGRCFQKVSSRTSGVVDFHGVTGGVYKTRERIQRSVLICVY